MRLRLSWFDTGPHGVCKIVFDVTYWLLRTQLRSRIRRYLNYARKKEWRHFNHFSTFSTSLSLILPCLVETLLKGGWNKKRTLFLQYQYFRKPLKMDESNLHKQLKADQISYRIKYTSAFIQPTMQTLALKFCVVRFLLSPKILIVMLQSYAYSFAWLHRRKPPARTQLHKQRVS